MVERDGRRGVAGDHREARMIALDQAAKQSGDAARDLGIALACRRGSRRCRRHRRSARWAAAFSVGSSTDSPPTPESKKRMGAKASIDRHSRAAAVEAMPVAAASGCFAARDDGSLGYATITHDPRDAPCPGARISARVDPVRAAADAARRQGRHARHRLGQHRRDQCAADRKQAARRADPDPRLPQGDRGDLARQAAVRRGERRSPRPRRDDRASLSGLAEVPRRQGRRDLARKFSSRCCRSRRRRLCRDLAPPAADVPNLVGCGNDGGGQRADHGLRSFIPLISQCCSVSRCSCCGSTGRTSLVSWKEPSHEWERGPRPRRQPEAVAHAGHRARHLSPADRPLRHVRGGACGGAGSCRGAVAARRPRCAAATTPSARSRGSRSSARKWLALGQGLYPRLLAELEDAPPLLIAQGRPQSARPAVGRDRRCAQRVGGGLPLRARPGPRPWAA